MQIRSLGQLTALRAASAEARTFWKFAIGRALNQGDVGAAVAYLERDAECAPHVELLAKSAIEALTTTPGSSAGPLAATRSYAQAFLGLVRSKDVLLRMDVRTAPMNVTVPAQRTRMSGGWAGQGVAAMVVRMTLDTLTLAPAKLAGIMVITKTLARSSDPAATRIVEGDLVDGVADICNVALLDPTLGPIPEVRPASLTFGATEITPSGDEIDVDVAQLLGAISGGNPERPYLVMSPRSALYLATQRGALGERLFPNVGLLGGDILGVPILIATGGVGDRVVAIDAGGVVVADQGVELDPAEHATVQMDDAPTNAAGGAGSPTAPTATTLVSLWQTNSIAIRATRFVNWQRRDDAVAFLELSGSPLP